MDSLPADVKDDLEFVRISNTLSFTSCTFKKMKINTYSKRVARETCSELSE